MKKILSSILLCAALCLPAWAQLGTNGTPAVGATGGVVYTAINAGTNNVPAATTVSYTGIVIPVAMHPNVGIDLAYQCLVGATNGNIVLTLAKSYDNGNTYETTPSIKLTNALPTAVQFAANATNYVALFDLSLLNATHVQVVSIQNTAVSSGTITNVIVLANLNNPTYWTVPAQR